MCVDDFVSGAENDTKAFDVHQRSKWWSWSELMQCISSAE